jgi:hypothetical protein
LIGGQYSFAIIFARSEVGRSLGRLEFRKLLAVGRLERLDLDPGAAELRVRLLDGNLVWRGVDPKKELALVDALIVLDSDFNNLAGNPSVDRLLCRANEGVVGRDKRLFGEVVGGADHGQQDGERDQQWAA